MKKTLLVLVTLWLMPQFAGALELKNVRPCFGPHGATRTELKFLPKDVVFIAFDIEGLAVDPKTGKFNYTATLEMVDDKEKSLFKKATDADPIPRLGGNRMPGDLHIILGSKQAPGKYTIRLSVTDNISKETKAFSYPFLVLPEGFGLVLANAAAIGVPGGEYMVSFAAVNLTLDPSKKPSADVSMRILDESGKAVVAPTTINLPKDIPETIDLSKENFVPLSFPIANLNRPGRFIVEIVATDKLSKQTVGFRYNLIVLDVASIASSSR